MGIARRLGIAALTGALALGLAGPATALSDEEAGSFAGKLTATYNDPTGPGDGNPYDFDIVTKAALATGVFDELAGAPSFTLFAPNDRAFEVLAKDLGLLGKNYRFTAKVDEALVFNKLAGSGVDIADVLRYHALVGAKVTGAQVLSGPFTQRVDMYNGDKLRITVLSRSARFPVIVLGDADGKALNDLVVRPDVISTPNTVVHSISNVLLPPKN